MKKSIIIRAFMFNFGTPNGNIMIHGHIVEP